MTRCAAQVTGRAKLGDKTKLQDTLNYRTQQVTANKRRTPRSRIQNRPSYRPAQVTGSRRRASQRTGRPDVYVRGCWSVGAVSSFIYVLLAGWLFAIALGGLVSGRGGMVLDVVGIVSVSGGAVSVWVALC